MFIFVRKQLSTQTMTDTDSFLPITGISIQFNNQAGEKKYACVDYANNLQVISAY